MSEEEKESHIGKLLTDENIHSQIRDKWEGAREVRTFLQGLDTVSEVPDDVFTSISGLEYFMGELLRRSRKLEEDE